MYTESNQRRTNIEGKSTVQETRGVYEWQSRKTERSVEVKKKIIQGEQLQSNEMERKREKCKCKYKRFKYDR